MDRYRTDKLLGEGSFGTVHLAFLKETGEKRAIKHLKGTLNWDNMIRMRELQSLMRLGHHPFIVKLYEVHRSDSGLISLVFEYMPDGCLNDFIQTYRAKKSWIPESVIASLTKQASLGLDHLHRQGYLHRDLKPENLLLKRPANTYDVIVLKLADFSLARGAHESSFRLTDYISTRWYRAPEVLLMSLSSGCRSSWSEAIHSAKDYAYDKSMDVFAMGCIVAELFRLQPLFPGRDELDQLQHIVNLLGPLPDSLTMLSDKNLCVLPQKVSDGPIKACIKARVEESVTGPSSFAAKDFVYQTLHLDPSKRLSSEAALKHAFLLEVSVPVPAVAMFSQQQAGREGMHIGTSFKSDASKFLTPEASVTTSGPTVSSTRKIARKTTAKAAVSGLSSTHVSPHMVRQAMASGLATPQALSSPSPATTVNNLATEAASESDSGTTPHALRQIPIANIVSSDQPFRLRVHDKTQLNGRKTLFGSSFKPHKHNDA